MGEMPPKLVRIFISSPSDVAEERKGAAELIEQELAKRAAFRDRLKLDPFRYNDPHSDTPFFASRSAQGSVDARLRSADAEIVVAILWARMGTPVCDPSDPNKILYQSGTEQEVEEALKAGREVLVYFRRGPRSLPDSDDEVTEVLAQRDKVRAFRARLEKSGRGVNDYEDVDDFKRKLEQHLDQLLTQIRDKSLQLAADVTIKYEEFFELKNLLRGVEIPDDRVDLLFHQILPDSRDFDVISDQSHFFCCLDFLAKKRHAPPDRAPLLEFLEHCRDLITDKVSRRELNTWTARVSKRLGVNLKALRNRVRSTTAQTVNSAESPVVLVKIEPRGRVSETEFTVTVWCRHGGKDERVGLATRPVRKDRLEAELQSIIERLAFRYFEQTLRLEIILPIALLDWNTHRIKLSVGPYTELLGERYPVTVRSWERTYHPAYNTIRPNWPIKWNTGPKDLSCDNIRCVFSDDIDGKMLSKELEMDKDSWVLLSLFPPPKDRTRVRDIFGAPLVAGLPFIFWPLVEQLDFVTLLKELQSWILEHPSDEWPGLLCQERKSAARSHWNDFLMLCDDPEHLPPDVKYKHVAPGR